MDEFWPDGIGRAVLTGRVFVGGRAAGGATVRVKPASPGPWVAPQADTVVFDGGFEATTDTAGLFSLEIPGGYVPLTGTIYAGNKVLSQFSFAAGTGATVQLSDVVSGSVVTPRSVVTPQPTPGGGGILHGDGQPPASLTAAAGSMYVDMLTGDVYTMS